MLRRMSSVKDDESLLFDEDDVPALPKHNIVKLNEKFGKMDPLEAVATQESELSARGIAHRSQDFFDAVIKKSNFVLQQPQEFGVMNSRRKLYSLFARAYANHRLGRWVRAAVDYDECIRLNSQWALPYFNRACIEYTQGNFQEAIDRLTQASKLDPTNRTYIECRAMIHRERGNYKVAANDYLQLQTLSGTAFYETADSPEEVHLWELLAMKPEARAHIEIKQAFKTIKTLNFFAKLKSKVVKKLLKVGRLVSCYKGGQLFAQGDMATEYYIILKGAVSIIVEKKDDQAHIEKSRVVVKNLNTGDAFGEPSGSFLTRVRTASVQCTVDTKLLSISYDDYERLFSNLQTSIVQEKIDVLKTCSLFASLPDSQLYRLAQICNKRLYEPHRVIISRNQQLHQLYVIRKGVCQTTKLVKIPVKHAAKYCNDESWVVERNSIAQSSNKKIEALDWIVEKGDVEHYEKEFIVATLASGQVFGEECLLQSDAVYQCSTTALTMVELYEIRAADLVTLNIHINFDSRRAVQNSIMFHNPHPAKLRQMDYEESKWQKKKTKIIQEILTEKMEKRGFSRSMASNTPYLQPISKKPFR